MTPSYVSNAFCPTGEGGGVDPSCSPGGGGSAAWENPTREQLDRAQAVFKGISEGPAEKYMDRQMRGGVLTDSGKFTEFTEKTKQTNLNKIAAEIKAVQQEDPEAFEAARQWELADKLGVKSYSDVPDQVTIYRGHSSDEKLGKTANLTFKKEIAEKFGDYGSVTTYSIDKGDISFTLSNSVFDEGELLVFDTKKLRVVDVRDSDYITTQKKIRSLPIGAKLRFKDGTKGTLKSFGVGLSLIVLREDGNTDYGVSPEDWDLDEEDESKHIDNYFQERNCPNCGSSDVGEVHSKQFLLNTRCNCCGWRGDK